MKTNITKKAKQELKNIIDNKGYWSDDTRDFIDKFNYTSRRKLHQIAQVYDKYQYGL